MIAKESNKEFRKMFKKREETRDKRILWKQGKHKNNKSIKYKDC